MVDGSFSRAMVDDELAHTIRSIEGLEEVRGHP